MKKEQTLKEFMESEDYRLMKLRLSKIVNQSSSVTWLNKPIEPIDYKEFEKNPWERDRVKEYKLNMPNTKNHKFVTFMHATY